MHHTARFLKTKVLHIGKLTECDQNPGAHYSYEIEIWQILSTFYDIKVIINHFMAQYKMP